MFFPTVSINIHLLTIPGSLPEHSRPLKSSTPAVLKQSARWQVSKELYQTESNYVDILTTVLQVCHCGCWAHLAPLGLLGS